MNKYIHILFIAINLIWAFNAQASNFSYNYFQVSYINSNIDLGNSDINGDSISLSGSFAVNNDVHAIAKIQSGSYDLDLDTDLFAIGAGFHISLSPNADAVFNAMLLDSQVKVASLGRSDDTGNQLEAALRYSSNKKVEINASIKSIDLYNDTESVFGVGALIKFGNERWFVVNYSNGDENSDIELGFRMEF